MIPTCRVICGNVFDILPTLADSSVHCGISSPPYFGLRSYLPEGHPDKAKEVGTEKTPQEYVEKLVRLFREVRRVLHPTGVFFLNLGDSYARPPEKGGSGTPNGRNGRGENYTGKKEVPDGLKPKDLIGVPWRVALALQADGWWLRQDIIWSKPSPMPSSVTDRCTTSHEYVFLLAKSARYFYDAVAVREKAVGDRGGAPKKIHDDRAQGRHGETSRLNKSWEGSEFANKRSVWTVATQGYSAAHFATFPQKLVEPMVKAGTSFGGCCPKCLNPYERITEKKKLKRSRPNDHVKRTGEAGTGNSCGNTVAGVEVVTLGWEPTCKCDAGDPVPCTVLDPFSGAGTTGLVSLRLRRNYVGCELNEEYVRLTRERYLKEGGHGKKSWETFKG